MLKTLAIAFVLMLPMLGSASKPAAAEVNYPWCLIMGGNDGSWNCGFVTWQQCQVTRVGLDMCVPNPRYSPAVRR